MRQTKTKLMGCEEVLRQLFTYLDNQLGRLKHREIERHLEACRSCFSRAEFERRLRDHLRAVGQSPVPPSLERRVKTLLKRL